MSQSANVDRFTGLAEGYQKYRPEYPAGVLGEVAAYWSAGGSEALADKLLVDVGGGTGKSLRAILPVLGPEWRSVVVEPNDDMRAQAEAAIADLPAARAVKGAAEALPFKDGEVGIVLAAQAAHWFDRPKFYAEAARVLAPGGVLCILYNNRDLYGNPLLAEFETHVEQTVPTYSRNYRERDMMAELRPLAWARDAREFTESWSYGLTPEGFTGLMMSRSQMNPYKQAVGEAQAERTILDMARRHADAAGMVHVPYLTQASCVRR